MKFYEYTCVICVLCSISCEVHLHINVPNIWLNLTKLTRGMWSGHLKQGHVKLAGEESIHSTPRHILVTLKLRNTPQAVVQVHMESMVNLAPNRFNKSQSG